MTNKIAALRKLAQFTPVVKGKASQGNAALPQGVTGITSVTSAMPGKEVLSVPAKPARPRLPGLSYLRDNFNGNAMKDFMKSYRPGGKRSTLLGTR